MKKFLLYYAFHHSLLTLDSIAFNEFVSIGVARIFDWGGAKPQITRNDIIKNFQKKNFLWRNTSYNKRSEAVACWHLTRILVKGEGKN